MSGELESLAWFQPAAPVIGLPAGVPRRACPIGGLDEVPSRAVNSVGFRCEAAVGSLIVELLPACDCVHLSSYNHAQCVSNSGLQETMRQCGDKNSPGTHETAMIVIRGLRLKAAA